MSTIVTRTGKGTPLTIAEVDANFTNLNNDKIETSTKDASGGVAGLTGFKLNLKNAAGTVTNFLTNATTAARTWTFPDKDGTVALIGDVLPNVTNVFSDAAPNDVVNVAGIQVVAPTASAHLLLQPKGAGGIATGISINPSYKTGLSACDFTFGNGRASGTSSVAFGNSQATGANAVSFGQGIAAGSGSIAFGGAASGVGAISFGGVASGNKSVAFGNSTAQGTNSTSFGQGGVSNRTSNKLALTGTDNIVSVACGMLPLFTYTDETAPAVLSVNGLTDAGAYDSNNTFSIALNTVTAFDILLTAIVYQATAGAAWKITGLLTVAGILNSATVSGVTVTEIANNIAGLTVTAGIITADTVLGGITITAPAATAGNYFGWAANIRSVELSM